MRAHATFGLINSTPHSVRSHGRRMAVKSRPAAAGEHGPRGALAPAAPDAG